jgi:hypothetical protein
MRAFTLLETLSIHSSSFKESDLKCPSQCPGTSHLAYLDLRNFSMKKCSLEPLQLLLEKVAGTLEVLVLEHCEIMDSQLKSLLPALSAASSLSPSVSMETTSPYPSWRTWCTTLPG